MVEIKSRLNETLYLKVCPMTPFPDDGAIVGFLDDGDAVGVFDDGAIDGFLDDGDAVGVFDADTGTFVVVGEPEVGRGLGCAGRLRQR